MSTLQSPDDMTPEQLAMALKNIKPIEAWILAVKEHAFMVLERGDKVPGFKLGYGSKKRIWKSGEEEKAIAAFAKLGIARQELYSEPELLSPPKVEKVLKEHGAWPKKKRNEEKPATPLDPFIELSMPEPRVMPITGHEDDLDGRLDDAAREFG